MVNTLNELEQEMIEAAETATVSQGVGDANVNVAEIPGAQRMTIRPEDVGAWVPAWELKVDRDKQEYGVSAKLPSGQLAHYLAKRREKDGGRRFTTRIPERLAPEPQYVCPIGECTKRVDMRTKLLGHIQNYHSQESLYYSEFLDQLKSAIVRDNPKMAALFADIAKTPEHGLVSVPLSMRQASTLLVQEEQSVSVSGIDAPIAGPQVYYCGRTGCGRFFDSVAGRDIHASKPHKEN